jgi:hypothetical protein
MNLLIAVAVARLDSMVSTVAWLRAGVRRVLLFGDVVKMRPQSCARRFSLAASGTENAGAILLRARAQALLGSSSSPSSWCGAPSMWSRASMA